MDEAIKNMICEIIEDENLLFEGCDKTKIAKEIMLGFIFGPYTVDQHYQIDDIYELVCQKYNELFPVAVEPFIG